jgi:hypothetical protein
MMQPQGGPPWSVANINIKASLPKLPKHPSLNAIRRILPAGEPVYERVDPVGDRMVTREVIARYLSCDAQASETPAAAVAVTPDTYKFSYQSSLTGRRYST